MTEAIKHLFQNTLNPDPQRRRESENELQKLVSNKEFVYSLPGTYMKDSDPLIRQVSATFFKNAVIEDLDLDVVNLAVKDPVNVGIYGEIISQHVAKNKEYVVDFQNIIRGDTGKESFDTALLILNAYAERDRTKFSNAATSSLLQSVDPLVFFNKLKNCQDFRKTLSKIFDNYYVPPQLLDVNFLRAAISHALAYTDKHSAGFLLRISTRSFKGLLNCDEIRQDERILNYFYCLQGHDQYKAEYFILYCQDENADRILRQDMLNSLIETLIIPNLAYKDADVHDDLKLKYNYTDDTHNSCSLLFTDILKVSNKQDAILQYMKNLLRSENPKERYVGLSLFVQSEPLLRGSNLYPEFVESVKACLEDPHNFIKSQAFYALQLMDIENIGEDRRRVFNMVLDALKSGDESIRTNSALCLPIFFDAADLRNDVERNLPIILNTLVYNPLNLEQISETLETVIDTFDISCYAVDLCKKMIDSVKIDNIETTPYLRIISDLILSLEEKRDVVFKIYELALPTLFYVLKNKKYDFYTETLDIISNVLYVFKTGDQNILELVRMVLESDQKELINCSEEMTYLLDNYISHCNVSNLDKIVSFVDILCYQEDEYLFDEDFINGCKIIESLILNGKYVAEVNYMEHFLKIVFDNYSKLDNNSLVYGLEILLNALNIDACSGSTRVYSILKPNMDVYIQDMYNVRKRFSRVHDKKIGLLFCANIMRFKDTFDVSRFLALFTHLLYTYDQAEVLRQKIENNEEIDNDAETEYDESDEYLEEDVYFITPLDNINVKSFLRSVLPSLENGTFGYSVFSAMEQREKERVLAIINN
ncbi:Nuclear transport receptor RANBP7/RANBP8 (importin beta superfamily) [Trachipleistophora hominis]|uniref:Nuclear transport receptor RANBP7/RANBP8 (Importin beta superfamily) n=1 Tax=Trachipleistophora hominis TaxID=72359 RepID=L7JYR4_TRAHO|nr:Nuclear transport receptor RANBP7/RANBP8 (importin beta superfamily) [Trachipleistophora hominis]